MMFKTFTDEDGHNPDASGKHYASIAIKREQGTGMFYLEARTACAANRLITSTAPVFASESGAMRTASLLEKTLQSLFEVRIEMPPVAG
jgi:hypothetical protein